MRRHQEIPTEKVSHNNHTAFLNEIIALTLFGVLVFPAPSSAFTPTASRQTGYDSYLLATQEIGQTLAQGIKAGSNNTQALYGRALSSLDPSSYVEYSNNLGQTFANTLTQGMGASQDLSQKIWNTDPYGHLTGNVSDIFDSIGNYFGSLFNGQSTTNNQSPTTTKPQPPKPTAPKPVSPPTQPTFSPPPVITTHTPPSPPQPTQVIVQRVLGGITAQDLELKIEQLRNELVSKIGAVAGQSQSNYNNNFAAIALTNKIDQLTNTVINNPNITGGSLTNTSISGGSISGATISGSLSVSSGTFSGNLTVQGTGTSTFAGGIQTNLLNVTSTTASSTFANGINLTAGCFAINGTCVGGSGGGSGTVGSGTTGQFPYYAANGTTLTATSSLFISTASNVGIGTTSPGSLLSIQGVANFTTATSTFYGGLNLTAGCYAINGTCVGGSGGTVTSIATNNGLTGGTITTTGTIGLAAIAANSVLGNSTGSSGVPSAIATSSLFQNASASVSGLLTSADWSTFSAKQAVLSFTYPLINTANTISTAFGTTTANSFNQLQQFNANASTTQLTVTGNAYFPSGIWNTSGSVGIGTTSPYAKLSVVGETVSSYFTATSTTATTTLNGGFAVGTGASPSGLVYDRSTGFVGIGTPTAGRPLEIYNSSGMKINNPGFNSFYVSVSSAGTNFSASADGTGDANHINFYTPSTQGCDYQCGDPVRMTIRGNTGNVGIGTTSPWRTLSVAGSMAIDSPTISTTGDYLCWNTTTHEIEAGTTCSLSSENFKQDIVPLSSGLAQVMALNPVSFRFKPGYGDNGSTTQLGFIAEQAATVDPRFVTFDTEGKPNGFVYPNFTAVLTKAIQEQEARIAALEANAGIVKDITSGWSIDVNGKLVVGEVEANKVTTKTLCIDDLCIGKDTLRALLEKNGVTQSASVINNTQPIDSTSSSQTVTEPIPALTPDLTSTTTPPSEPISPIEPIASTTSTTTTQQ